MATYRVKHGQNLFDIAVCLYGSIEGLFDLLISNPKLSLNDDLQPGTELEYHEYFVINSGIVDEMQKEHIVPGNGERHVYFKEPVEEKRAICTIPPDKDYSSLIVSGDGHMVIDWGDNSDLESIALTLTHQVLEHYFDNKVNEKRKIKIYGDFRLTFLDTSEIGGDLLLLKPLVVDEYRSTLNGYSLKGLFLFDGTVTVDLQSMTISDLSPIYDMSLQALSLTRVRFTSISVLDDYLVYIAENYGNRRDCTVYMDTEPSQKGMEAIEKIINEPSWNESGKWKFIINDKIYTK